MRAGNAAHMQFEAAGGEGEGGEGAAPPGRDADMEAAMHRLLAERARKYEQDKAVRWVVGQGGAVWGSQGVRMRAARPPLCPQERPLFQYPPQAKEELGRGRRARGSVQGANAEDRRGIYYESDADDSPGRRPRWGSAAFVGAGRRCRALRGTTLRPLLSLACARPAASPACHRS